MKQKETTENTDRKRQDMSGQVSGQVRAGHTKQEMTGNDK